MAAAWLRTRGRASLVASAAGLLALAGAGCDEPRDEPVPFDAGRIVDARSPDFGPPPRPDARVRDLGFELDGGAGDTGMRPEVGDLDLGVPAGPGESCKTALPWSGAPLVSSTTVSRHRARLVCSAPGASGRAPEAWWLLEATPGPSSVRLEVGSPAFAASVAARPAGCERAGERCASGPPVLELPVVDGPLPVAVEGFAGGAGRYVLSASRGPALVAPPVNASCGAATSVETATTGHDFSAHPYADAACPLEGAVFFVAPPTGSRVSVRARGGQRLGLVHLPACGGTSLGCRVGELGESRVESVVPGGAGILAVGHVGTRAGSFVIETAEPGGARCLAERDCPFGQVCAGGACDPAASGARFEGRRPIPDLGALEIPLEPSGGPARIARARIRVRLEHPFPEDLVVTLTSPAGIEVRLRDRSAHPLDVVYGEDREADGPGRLFDFAAGSSSGRWVLRVRDVAPGDEGAILGARLEVE